MAQKIAVHVIAKSNAIYCCIVIAFQVIGFAQYSISITVCLSICEKDDNAFPTISSIVGKDTFRHLQTVFGIGTAIYLHAVVNSGCKVRIDLSATGWICLGVC